MADVLGKLAPEYAKRDAVHVAIAPVVADQRLAPGQRVGFVDDARTSVGVCPKPLGIVDPFLGRPVEKGERFYLVLFPNTITSLRHDWTHPAFPAEGQTSMSEHEMWLRIYASRMNCYDTPEEAFQRLIEGLQSQELFAYGRDLHGFHELEDPEELRTHAEAYLGRPLGDWGRFTFSCSC